MKKQLFRKALVATVLVICMLISEIPNSIYAKTSQEKLDEAMQQRDQLEDKIEDTQEELDSLNGSKSALQKKLKELNTELTEVSENLADIERQIREKCDEIEQTQADLEEARAQEEWQYECLVKHIRFLYAQGETALLDTLLSLSGLGEYLDYAAYVKAMERYDKTMMEEYEAQRAYVEEEEARLQLEKIELDDLRAQAEDEQARISELVSETSEAIAKYADQIADAEAEALKYEKELKEKEKDIEKLKKIIEEEKRLAALAAAAKWRDISEVTFAAGDRDLLAAIIYCEAGGEPYAGKLAVGAVVINRLLSSKYPDTVVGVIYQKSQFSPVKSGRLEVVLSSGKATASCYQAADEAMSGITNVGTCLYFRTPIEGLTGISIGGHIFY